MTLTKQLCFYYLKEISYYKVYVGLLYKRNINKKEKNMNCHATNPTVLSFCHMYFQICFNLFIQCYLNIAYKLSPWGHKEPDTTERLNNNK